jgi:hypothetical protein
MARRSPLHAPYFHSGNHDAFLETDPAKRSLLRNATVLINQSAEVAGLKLWDSPMVPLAGMAFGIPSAAGRRRLYDIIPEDTDILISHGPPLGILDIVPGSNHHAADPELLQAVQRVQPMLHVFGHIHGAYGNEELDGTLFVNAALMNQNDEIDRNPVIVRLAKE